MGTQPKLLQCANDLEGIGSMECKATVEEACSGGSHWNCPGHFMGGGCLLSATDLAIDWAKGDQQTEVSACSQQRVNVVYLAIIVTMTLLDFAVMTDYSRSRSRFSKSA